MNAFADTIGITIIGAALFAIAHYIPAETLTGGMFIFFFLVLAVMGVYFWHRDEPPQSAREWVVVLAAAILSALIIFAIGIGFAHLQGVRGTVFEMVSSNGTFLLLTIYCPTVILIAFSSTLRAVVIEKYRK